MNYNNIWNFAYGKRYYLMHPWKWFKELRLNWKNFWHRRKYGFTYTDVWDFCTWYPTIGAQALRYLAEHASGYPGYEPWDTPEKWREYLLELAKKLEICADSMNIWNDKNEYSDELQRLARRNSRENPDGTISTWIDATPEYEEIRKKYWAREEEIQNENQKFREETFAEVGRVLASLWD